MVSTAPLHGARISSNLIRIKIILLKKYRKEKKEKIASFFSNRKNIGNKTLIWINFKLNFKRVLGRVWFMALVLKTSTLQKVVGSNPTVPVYLISIKIF